MKKRKFGLLLNIATICLCVCAIAIGVYSAKQASLTISGSIGFEAHDCEVYISGIMNAYTPNEAGTDNEKVVKYFNSTGAEGGDALLVKQGGDNSSWDIGTVCFDDLYTDKYHEINDIEFEFTITNNSEFYVDVIVNQDFINNDRIFVYAPNNGETLSPKGDTSGSNTLSLIVKIQLKKDSSGEYSNLSSAVDITSANAAMLNFSKSLAPSYLATDWKTQIQTTFGVSNLNTSTKISFVQDISELDLTSFDKNDDNSLKTANVGAINEISSAGNLTDNVTDITAYYKTETKEVVIYSQARIYAPQSCDRIFGGYNALSDLNLNNFDTSKVTDATGMFFKVSVQTIDISSLDTSNVKSMQGMFTTTANLTSLDLLNFNTSQVTDMSYMFQKDSISSLDVSNFNTGKVTDMSYMFYGCTNLTSLEMNNFDTSSVTTLRAMFYNCTALTSLDVSSFNTSEVTDMSHMFCEVGYKNSIDKMEIYGLENFDTSNVTTMNGMFSSSDQNQFDSKLTNRSLAGLSNWNVSKVTDMTCMFYGASSITQLDLSKWDVSSCMSFNHMFADCKNLKKMDMTNWNVQSLRTCYNMFNDCQSLALIGDISNWNTANLYDAGSMFARCYSLSGKLDLSGWVTTNLRGLEETFLDCKNLTEIDLSGWNTSIVQYITDDIILTEKWPGLPDGATKLSNTIYYVHSGDNKNCRTAGLFGGCTNLTAIYVGDGWDETKHDSTTFKSCGVTEVTKK